MFVLFEPPIAQLIKPELVSKRKFTRFLLLLREDVTGILIRKDYYRRNMQNAP